MKARARVAIALLIILITACLFLQLGTQYTNQRTSESPIPQPVIVEAYSTTTIRIEDIDLQDIVSRAEAAGYNVSKKDYLNEWTPGEGTIYIRAYLTFPENEETGISLEYDKYQDITHVEFSRSGSDETYDAYWSNLSRYMKTSEWLLKLQASNHEEHAVDMTFTVPGEPDWDTVREDMGGLNYSHD